jgi:mono/diheme cytochrome c family protein
MPRLGQTLLRGQFMQHIKFAVFSAAALTLIALPGTPASAADAAHGRALAQRWCAACHIVTIARSNFNATTLAYFLLDPHPKMPALPLSRPAADDLAAYIESLR